METVDVLEVKDKSHALISIKTAENGGNIVIHPAKGGRVIVEGDVEIKGRLLGRPRAMFVFSFVTVLLALANIVLLWRHSWPA